MKIIVSDNKQIKSIYDSESCVLRTHYSGMFNAELAINHFHEVENFSKTHLIKGVLADLRKLSGSFNKVMDYLSSEGFNKMKTSGLEAEALVISDDLMMQHLSEKLTTIMKNKELKSNTFSSYDEANTWLLEAISK